MEKRTGSVPEKIIIKAKRSVTLLIIGAMLVCMLAGCGKSPKEDSSGTAQTEESGQSGADTSTEEGGQSGADTTSDKDGQSGADSSDISSNPNDATANGSEGSDAGTETSDSEGSTDTSESANPSEPDESGSEGTTETSPGGGLVEASAPVTSEFFDDAVIVGDSVTAVLEYFAAEGLVDLGGATFLSSGSLGSGNALWSVSDESVHPSLWGTKMRIEDAIALLDVSKVYIMLGMNDIWMYGVDGSIENFEELVSLILASSPNVTIYVESMTPVAATGEIFGASDLPTISEYNEKLLEACGSNGWYFVNVAEALTDEEGFLPFDYCSDPYDMGIHLTLEACEVWVDYLYTHTGE